MLVFLNNQWRLWEPGKNRIVVPARQVTQPGGIGFLELILGLLKSLKIRAQAVCYRTVRGPFFPLGTKNSIVRHTAHDKFYFKKLFSPKREKKRTGRFLNIKFYFSCMYVYIVKHTLQQMYMTAETFLV